MEETSTPRILSALSRERKKKHAIRWGGQWAKWVDEETYGFLMRYRDSLCLVAVKKEVAREIEIPDLEFPDGTYKSGGFGIGRS